MAELVQKLGLKEGHLICLLEAPDEASQIMEGILPPSTSIHTSLQSSDYDMILIWPLNLEGLDQLLARLQEYIKPNGAIWAIIPKQKYARQRCEPGEGYGSLTITDVLDDHVKPLGVPAWQGAMIGHVDRQFLLPVGLEVEADATAGTIRMLEPAVL